MSIRTEAIELYIGAYNKLKGMHASELEEIELDGVGNRGIGFEYDGIKFGFAKGTWDNSRTVCPFCNVEKGTICIPLQPAALESREFMQQAVVEAFCQYMNFISEAVLHELIHMVEYRHGCSEEGYVDISEGDRYYNSYSERLAYSGEIVSCIERRGLDVFKYFVKMLERRESVVKFIKRELRNILNLNTLILFVESLTEENYEWFKGYVKEEYDERMSYVC